jgi:transcriptional regulator with XRE-family HTH domain
MATKKKKPILEQQIKEIGDTFRQRRFDLKANLQEVASKSTITYLTISKLEKGELKNVSLETLNKIAGALNLTFSLLIIPKETL